MPERDSGNFLICVSHKSPSASTQLGPITYCPTIPTRPQLFHPSRVTGLRFTSHKSPITSHASPSSLRRPVRRFILALLGQLPRACSVGEHGPDLPRARAGRFKYEMAAIRSPAGTFVASYIARQLNQLARGDFHYVEIVISAGPSPAECQQL